MRNKKTDIKFRKIVQRFSKTKQEEFRHLSAKERLEWLEGIKSLYWKTVINKTNPRG
ncbi:MAG: hypothetical protein KA059_04315 [Elusimicrobiales bacterium]|jgi:hypothetical protein|nr:hypothetical protein [Elusimicrobiales bacterium]